MSPQPPIFPSQRQTQPRIIYFISRTNGILVPLIPADELPFNVRLQGVPRVLTFDQTHGMQHVGTAPYTGLTFKVEHDSFMQRSTSQPQTPARSRSHSNSETRQFQAPDALARQAILNSNSAGTTNGQQCLPQRPLSAHDLATNWRKPPTSEPTDDTQAIINAIVSSGAGAETAARIGYPLKPTTMPPSGNVPDQNKKEYCTHWIRTGECDFTQQGCLYKHEMPDEETLKRKIGLRKFPQWWIEKTRPIKMDRGNACVGPAVKPSVWLNQKRGSHSDSSDEVSGRSDSNTSSLKSQGKARTSKAQMATDKKEPAPSPTTCSSSPSPTRLRQRSYAGDLIDIAPLLPTPSTTPSLTPPSSTSGSPLGGTKTPVSLPEIELKQDHAVEPQTPIKVFVPAGESPVAHIAEAKKRATRSKTTTTRAIDDVGVQPLDKQIQMLQKNQHNGLMASKHAPPPNVISRATEHPATPAMRIPRSGCRVRRPASSVATSVPASDRVDK